MLYTRTREIDGLKKQIANCIEGDPDLTAKRDLLETIPGVGARTIAAILAELHMFERCDRVQKLVAFIGLAPKQFISGNSIKGKPRLSKVGNARLRKALSCLRWYPSSATRSFKSCIIA